MTDDRRPFQFTEERMAAAVAIAMKQVLTDPDVIASMGAVAFGVLQKQAAASTGGWILRTIRKFVSHWLVVAFILLMVAKYMGLPAALNLWTAAAEKTTQ